jgi:hypothetical protein
MHGCPLKGGILIHLSGQFSWVSSVIRYKLPGQWDVMNNYVSWLQLTWLIFFSYLMFNVLCSPSPVMASNMASLFEEHHLALQYLVPNLLKLYVDIEFTGSHTQVFLFYLCNPLSVQGYTG